MELPKKVRNKKVYVVVWNTEDNSELFETREDARANQLLGDVIYQAELHNFKKVR